MKESISVFIPAYNEEKNIKAAVASVLSALRGEISDYEVIIVDDGSTDSTGQEAIKLCRKNRRIRLIRHKKNLGFGLVMRHAIKSARKEYFSGFPGDNDMAWQSLREIIKGRKSADIVTSYMVNSGKRSLVRRIASKSFVVAINLLFRQNLKYYNGYFVSRTKLLRKLRLKSQGLAIIAEILIKLIKSGASYRQIPFIHTGRTGGRSKAVTGRSVRETLGTIWVLVREK